MPKIDPQNSIVMCFRVADPPDGWVPYKNSVQLPCVHCHELVWVGPTQNELAKAHHIPIICANCMIVNVGPQETLDRMQALTGKRMGQ